MGRTVKDKEFFLECVERNKRGEFTIGDFCTAVMQITGSSLARRFYSGYLQWLRGRQDREATPEETARMNIGWCFGEGMSVEQQRMWNQVTGAEHPVFGMALASDKQPHFEDILEAGKRMGAAGDLMEQMAIEKERFSTNAQKEEHS